MLLHPCAPALIDTYPTHPPTHTPATDLATCEPLSGGLGGGALLARPPDDSPTALLAPLGADGWISVELLPLLTDDDNDDEEEEKERLRRLAPALDCLRAALALAGKERAEGARARRRLRGLLREVCACVSVCGWGMSPRGGFPLHLPFAASRRRQTNNNDTQTHTQK